MAPTNPPNPERVGAPTATGTQPRLGHPPPRDLSQGLLCRVRDSAPPPAALGETVFLEIIPKRLLVSFLSTGSYF